MVSAPAENNREKNAPSSSSLSRGGSVSGSSAWITAESMSARRSGALLRDECGAVAGHVVDRLLALRAHGEEIGLVSHVEHVLDGIEQLVAVLFGDAHEHTDGLHGELGRHLDQEVALVAHGAQDAPHAPA